MLTLHQSYNYIIVSDLHASSGVDPQTGAFDPAEEFFHDTAFARFLDQLRERATNENRKWRLLILGDLLDFLQAGMGAPSRVGRRFDTDEAAILARLDRIAEGHPKLFAAIGSFAAAGFPVDVVPGNHDIELLFPPAQERFKALVARHSGQPEAAAGITFYPWIYYVPGLLYAEHGHQYHDINWFPTMLRLYSVSNHSRSELPLTSQFHEYVSDVLESLGSNGSSARSSIGALLKAVKSRPLAALGALPHHLGFVKSLLGHMLSFSSAGLVAKRAAYHEVVLRPHSRQVGLSYETLAAIDDLAFTTAGEIRQRLPRKLLVEPLLHWLPSIGAVLAMIAAVYIARRKRAALLSVPALALVSFRLIRRGLRTWQFAPRTSDYAYRAAQALHTLLQSENKRVPFYVLGHTHIAERSPLGADAAGASEAHYLNPGTWTAMVHPEPGTGERHVRLTFVEITREDSGPVARLMLWNDPEGRCEPLS